MEEHQATHLRGSFREDNDGQCPFSGVHRTAEDGDESPGLPAEALFYALPYMSLKELLCMEQLCKASRDWVKEGGMLWRTLLVESPLNMSFTDEILIRLFKRSKGQLECLCLVDCLKITERAVEEVVLSSPRLTKLFLPGCTRVSADGVVRMVSAHTNQRARGTFGIKELRVRNIAGLAEHHVQSLLKLMGAEEGGGSGSKPPRYFDEDYDSLSWISRRRIDVELCPKCTNVSMVFNCRRDECGEKQKRRCRTCPGCTRRCADCGVCLRAGDTWRPSACFDVLCIECWSSQAPDCSICHAPKCRKHSRSAFKVRETKQGNSIPPVCDWCCCFCLSKAFRMGLTLV